MGHSISCKAYIRLMALSASVVAFPLSALAVTYTLNFSGTTTGTVTYTNVNYAFPISFTFVSGATTYIEAGTITDSFGTLWVAAAPVNFDNNGSTSSTLTDIATGNFLQFSDLYAYFEGGGASDSGSYSFTPAFTVPMLPPLAITVLLGLLGLTGYRKLHA